jgi:hypothetical protein
MGSRNQYRRGDDVARFTRDPDRAIVRVKTVDLRPGMVLARLPNPGWQIESIVVKPNLKPRYDFVYGHVIFVNGPGPMTLETNASHNIYTDSITEEGSMTPTIGQQVLHPSTLNLVGEVVELDIARQRARVRWPNSGYEAGSSKRTWIAFKRLRPAPVN